MTRQRVMDDGKDTDFSKWLRAQPEIASEKGFITTDIDYLWRNYKTGEWMILEEKTHSAIVPRWQSEFISLVDALGLNDKLYRGAFLVRFENTDPDNGRVLVNKLILTRDEFISFLRFEFDIEPCSMHEIKPKNK